MNDNVTLKSTLWSHRIAAFEESGLSRKEWCQKNGIPQSTFSYWFRKLRAGVTETAPCDEPVFARLPSVKEIHSGFTVGHAPITICLLKNIRIEISTECPSELLDSLLQALKIYA